MARQRGELSLFLELDTHLTTGPYLDNNDLPQDANSGVDEYEDIVRGTLHLERIGTPWIDDPREWTTPPLL
jgi:hypothetical protein